MPGEGRENRQFRNAQTEFRAQRADNGDLFIEGYFAVFGDVYELWPGASESIDSHAFDDTIKDDIRCLIDHESRLVLGRTKAGTFETKVDSKGLWGRCKINQADQDAMNLYSRVERHDVDQCSFGFDILEESTDYKADGTVHWTLKKVKLWEESVCTFPAYEKTSVAVASRKQDYERLKQREHDAWKIRTKARLKNHGTPATNPE